MSDELVKRLRNPYARRDDGVSDEAADRIEELERQLANMEHERDVWRSKCKYLRNVALDDAAKVCRQCPDSHWGPWIEKRILALKTGTEQDKNTA